MANSVGSTRPVRDLLVKGLFGVGASVFVNFIVDFFRVPVLTDKGLFGNTSLTNYELFAYAISGSATMAGILDIFTNSKPLGFSKEFMPFFAGYGIGTSIFDNVLRNAIGLQKFDVYDFAYDHIPSFPVL